MATIFISDLHMWQQLQKGNRDFEDEIAMPCDHERQVSLADTYGDADKGVRNGKGFALAFRGTGTVG